MHALSRRTAMRLLAGVSAMPSLVAAAPIADLADRLDTGIRSGALRDVHAVLISRGGHVVLERYYAGADESWGRPLGMVSFGPDTLHDLRSVTKSVVGLLYGIALDRGLVPQPEAPLLEQFPEYPDLAADPQRARLTIAHALTMTLGMEWDEQRPYTDPANSEIAMENASDRNRFILERPFVAQPGERWIYSGGAVALLAPPDRQRLRCDIAGLRTQGTVRAARYHDIRMGRGAGWGRVRRLRPAPAPARPAAHR